MLAGTVVLAAALPSRDLAVATAVAGTFLGTVLLSFSLTKLVFSARAENIERDLTRSEIKGRLRRAETACESAERRALQAAEEIARLEAMRINIAAIQPITKLGLLEVETHVTDFQQRVVGDGKEEVWWRNGYRQTYVGAVRIPVKAHLAVDLQKVRVRPVGGNRLVLSGLTMVTVTDTAQGATWLLDEIRTEYLKEKQPVKFKGDVHDPRAKRFSRDQEIQVRARLKEGQDFRVFESGLIRTAEQVLRLLLSPLGQEISFEPDAGPEARELFDYLADHNRELEAKISGVKALR